MTKDEILAMELGRELDVETARVLGKRVYQNKTGQWLVQGSYKKFDRPPEHYSTDFPAAWLVVEEMRKSSDITFTRFCDGLMTALGLRTTNNHDNDVCVVSRLMSTINPKAICKAALLTRLDEIKRLEKGSVYAKEVKRND